MPWQTINHPDHGKVVDLRFNVDVRKWHGGEREWGYMYHAGEEGYSEPQKYGILQVEIP
ncbi:MAG: hypothetical protein NTV62_03730 [Candidatus Gribaldobacteria bacterium]|nr:hypothetical protein [Candidatus Gribaldobacteria bacterium]